MTINELNIIAIIQHCYESNIESDESNAFSQSEFLRSESRNGIFRFEKLLRTISMLELAHLVGHISDMRHPEIIKITSDKCIPKSGLCSWNVLTELFVRNINGNPLRLCQRKDTTIDTISFYHSLFVIDVEYYTKLVNNQFIKHSKNNSSLFCNFLRSSALFKDYVNMLISPEVETDINAIATSFNELLCFISDMYHLCTKFDDSKLLTSFALHHFRYYVFDELYSGRLADSIISVLIQFERWSLQGAINGEDEQMVNVFISETRAQLKYFKEHPFRKLSINTIDKLLAATETNNLFITCDLY